MGGYSGRRWQDYTFIRIGVAGSEYTPERDLPGCMRNWKPNLIRNREDITVTYEARIGDTSYEELEEAFADAQAGDTITVLKDCRYQPHLKLLLITSPLKSEDAGNPATISREEDFAGKAMVRILIPSCLQ